MVVVDTRTIRDCTITDGVVRPHGDWPFAENDSPASHWPANLLVDPALTTDQVRDAIIRTSGSSTVVRA